MESSTTGASVKCLVDDHGVALKVAELQSGNEVNLFLGLGFKVGIPNVANHDSQSVCFTDSECQPHNLKRYNTRVSVVVRRSDMSTSDHPSLVPKVMLAVVDPDHFNLEISFGGRGTLAEVSESIVLEQVRKFNLLRVSPLSVTGFLLEQASFTSVAWDLDTKLVSNGSSTHFGRMDPVLQDLLIACHLINELPTE